MTLLVTASVVLPLLPPSWITTVYARGLFPVIQGALVPATGSVGVSLSAAVLLTLLGFAIGRVSMRIRRSRSPTPSTVERSSRTAGARSVVRRSVVVLCTVWLWFLLAWGLGYRQEPIEQRWELPELGTPADRQAGLHRFADELVAILVDEPRIRDVDRALDSIKRSLASIIEREEGFRPAMPNQLKILPAGFLSKSGFTGIVSPFLLEAHVDGAVAETDRVAVGAHELAHLCGVQGEADADAVSILAGLGADDRFARYCVALRTLHLIRADLGPRSFRLRFAALPASVQRDYRHRIERLRRMRSKVASRVVRRVYDGYLKSQGVASGIADYGRGVELLLRIRQRGG